MFFLKRPSGGWCEKRHLQSWEARALEEQRFQLSEVGQSGWEDPPDSSRLRRFFFDVF